MMNSVAKKLSRNFYTRSAATRKAFALINASFTIRGAASGREALVRQNWKRLRQPVRYFGEVGKFGGQFSRKLPGSKTPLPIPAVQAWRIHAGFAAQAQHILQRDEAKIGHRALRRANEPPMNSILAASKIGFRIAPFVIGSAGAEPAHGSVIVVRSRVDDLAAGTMRQIHVRTLVAETELQHRHPRNLQALPQRMNLRRNVAEIFCKKRQASKSLAQLVKQIVPRTIHPTPVYRSGIGRGNLPELVEPAEMVDPDVVAVPRCPPQPLDPPLIAFRLHHVPAVQRISPALPRLAEEIGRDSRNHIGLEIFIQPEQFAVHPHVGAVVVHKDRDVPHNANR